MMTVDATFIAFVAFSLFFVVMIWLKVPGMIFSALDTRSAEIAKELHEARRLREDAEKLHADYKAKHAKAEAEAKEIVATAKQQAAAVAAETKAAMEAALERRKRQVDDRIAAAGVKARDEVRAAATDAAIAAAERMIRERMTDGAQAALVEEGAADLTRKFG
jgi:F-type H+-transporting ATPase subunit b